MATAARCEALVQHSERDKTVTLMHATKMLPLSPNRRLSYIHASQGGKRESAGAPACIALAFVGTWDRSSVVAGPAASERSI